MKRVHAPRCARVYRLLGKNEKGSSEFPAIEMPLIGGEAAFRQDKRGHESGPNWPTFLKFADRYIKGPPPAKPEGKGWQ